MVSIKHIMILVTNMNRNTNATNNDINHINKHTDNSSPNNGCDHWLVLVAASVKYIGASFSTL